VHEVLVAWLSSRQLNTAPGSEENVKVAVVSVVLPEGPLGSRTVSGATVSTVHVRVAGAGFQRGVAARRRCTEHLSIGEFCQRTDTGHAGVARR
jgi:hypothetical protein